MDDTDARNGDSLSVGDGTPAEIQETTCCVVGAGPAGVMLSLLLARAGIRVTLLEAHRDFDRDFRGDTVHPSTLEVLDQIGLAERLHGLPHVKAPAFRTVTPTGVYTVLAFNRLPTPFPYMMIMPQSRFLEFLTDEAKRYPHFRILMGANVQRLVEENGNVRGVAYPKDGGWCELRALLTVATDGRFSRIRKLAHLEPVRQSGPMEVLWFRLPRRPDDHPDEATLNVGLRQIVVVLGRTQEWQVGVVLPKGGYQRLKAEGLNAFHQAIASTVPWLGDRVELLNDWHRVNVLSVEANRLVRWHRPGLLLLGDAAHVMLPVGGVGINCAIADAVEAANVLVEPLRTGRILDSQLAEVQRRREGSTRIVQRAQASQQKRIIRTLESGTPFRLPLPVRVMLRIPGLRNIPARVTAFGWRRVRLHHPQEIPFHERDRGA
jgi:2-polyprenyl-6-methoxyphenol hydroxylase-like FAD-dependent oxidoreductase